MGNQDAAFLWMMPIAVDTPRHDQTVADLGEETLDFLGDEPATRHAPEYIPTNVFPPRRIAGAESEFPCRA
jgi:hypothetical protein